MKFKTSEIVLFFLLILSLLSFKYKIEGDLIVELENVKISKGMIWLALYDSEKTFFDKNKSILKGVKVEKTGKISVTMPDVKFGEYALAVFHDTNNDGELNKNVLGIPTEPYAFSQEPKSKWRAPKYKELLFNFEKPNQRLSLFLETWLDK